MSILRERINCFKLVDGKCDVTENGRWLRIRETLEGGAKIDIKIDDLECLDRLNKRLGEGEERVVEMILDEAENCLIFVDEKGEQIPFGDIMRAVLD